MAELKEMYKKGKESQIVPLTGVLTATSATIPVEDATALSDAPNIAIIYDRFGENVEVVRYGGKTNNTLTDVTRGLGGTTAALWQPQVVDGRALVNVTNGLTSYEWDALVYNALTMQSAVEALGQQVSDMECTGVGGTFVVDFAIDPADWVNSMGEFAEAFPLTADIFSQGLQPDDFVSLNFDLPSLQAAITAGIPAAGTTQANRINLFAQQRPRVPLSGKYFVLKRGED